MKGVVKHPFIDWSEYRDRKGKQTIAQTSALRINTALKNTAM